MKITLLKKLRKEADKEVYISSYPHNFYIEITTGIPNNSNHYLVNDMPKIYIDRYLDECKRNYIRYKIDELKSKPRIRRICKIKFRK